MLINKIKLPKKPSGSLKVKLNRHNKILIEEDSFTKTLPPLSSSTKEAINAIAFNYYGYRGLDFLVLISKTIDLIDNPLGKVMSYNDIQALKALVTHCGGHHTLKFMFEFYHWCGHDKKSFYFGLLDKTDITKQTQLPFDKVLGTA